MRDELSALYQLLNTLARGAGLDPDAADPLLARVCSGLDATLDAQLQRVEQLEARCSELADELSAARDRLNDLEGAPRAMVGTTTTPPRWQERPAFTAAEAAAAPRSIWPAPPWRRRAPLSNLQSSGARSEKHTPSATHRSDQR